MRQTEEGTDHIVRRISRDYHEPIGDETTHVGQSQIAGLGLFSARSILKGEVVARFRQPGDVVLGGVQDKEWKTLYRLLPLPHDAGIEHGTGKRKRVLSDATWFDGDEFVENNPRPKWYRINHSDYPNLKAVVEDDMVYWKAMYPIPANQELTFNYGDVPSEWRTKRKAGDTSEINPRVIMKSRRRGGA